MNQLSGSLDAPTFWPLMPIMDSAPSAWFARALDSRNEGLSNWIFLVSPVQVSMTTSA